MSNENLKDHVLQIFSDLLSENFFKLIFAESKTLELSKFTISPQILNQLKDTTNNAQLAFLQLASQYNIIGFYKFRIHVTKCPGVQINKVYLVLYF